VFVLGAGFSRAVSRELPVTAALGEQSTKKARVARQRLPAGGFRGGRFETWLSRLAEDQPHLSVAENLGNREIFVRVVEALVAVLSEAELRALDNVPEWLLDLLSLVHHRRATLITLNYDGLVEAGVRTLKLPLATRSESVEPGDVLDDFPSEMGAAGLPLEKGAPAARGSTFRLLKLHGSLDWCWSYGDRTGSTVRRIETGASFGCPPDEPAYRRREARGLEPFVVPPTATKSGYYDNPVTRWLWREAAEALRQADQITLVGYSFPPEDLAMSGLIGDAIRRRRNVVVRVVDLHPAMPTRHLKRLRPGPVVALDGEDCVERFVGAYRDSAAAELIEYLRGLPDPADTRLYVGWIAQDGRNFAPYLHEIETGNGDGDLTLVPFPVGFANNIDDVPRLSDLVSKLTGIDRLVMKTASGGRSVPLIAASEPTGADGVFWVTLWAVGRV
jgi:hypothetical protein